MKKILTSLLAVFLATAAAQAEKVVVKWEFSDPDKLPEYSITTGAENILGVSNVVGKELKVDGVMTSGNAESGLENPVYNPPFTRFLPSQNVSGKVEGHQLAFSIKALGRTFKPTRVAFDAVKIGTDGGGIDVFYNVTDYEDVSLGSVNPLRNKATAGNPNGYSSHEFIINDVLIGADPEYPEEEFTLLLYINNVNGPNGKAMGFRNIVIEGETDSKIWTVGDFVSDITAELTLKDGSKKTESFFDMVKELKNGLNVRYATKVGAMPESLVITPAEGRENMKVEQTVVDKTINVKLDDQEGQGGEIEFSIIFSVSNRPNKPAPTALKRGLIAAHSSNGNLVSWRARGTDDPNLSFMVYAGPDEGNLNKVLNDGKPISGKTNILESGGSKTRYYRLDVLDANGNVIETEGPVKCWENQNYYIPLTKGAPTDPSGNGATYSPNDASFCDMDGDGEYEIILKWSPSNEKDAASSGATSNVFFDCYKLDGTQLWRIDMGHNFFASAHTMQFIAWDFDGDGYGEFMAKTAPGTKDGEGNYVLLGDDDPTANLKSGRGKQDHGPEYITVFDGMTGAEISTIPYHTDYAAGKNYWGDSNQNRSERYLAAIAWLDGLDKNPSPIFARGYYSGAFVGAYDFDGDELRERWVSRNTVSGQGLWGEGAHWISVGDCDGDGFQEIVYGSAALDHDGSLLYRTGLGHGDAMHLYDFVPENPGLEVFMVHEHKPYGHDLRDAKTGKLLLHETATGDTGRGIMLHCDPESEGGYYQTSSLNGLYDWKGNTIITNVSHGGGAGLADRVFWTGDLGECWYNKSVLERYEPRTKSVGRVQVNGTNYTTGTLNNSTKYNACVLGDLLGDWREEIVNWSVDGNGNYSLVVNTTNYPSDYTVPHLMEDGNYRSQLINQNVCYNQPPHLSYNLRNSKKVTRTATKMDMGNIVGTVLKGDYWDAFYTTYRVKVPADVIAWGITGINTDEQTVEVLDLLEGEVMPANTAIIYNSAKAENVFVPTTLGDPMTDSMLTGSFIDQTLGSDGYEFRLGDRGLGFYHAEGNVVKGRTAYLTFDAAKQAPATGASLAPAVQPESFALPSEINPLYQSGVEDIVIEGADSADNAIYNLQGIRLSEEPATGYYIKGGKVFKK